MKNRKVIHGFLLAPALPAALFATLAAGLGLFSNNAPSTGSTLFVFGWIAWFTWAAVTAYIATIVFGIPAYLFFRNHNIQSVTAYLIGGAALGAVSPTLLLIIFDWRVITDLGWMLFTFCAFFGVVTSYTFWHIAIKPSVQNS